MSSEKPQFGSSRHGSATTSIYASTVLSVESDDGNDYEVEPLNDQQWILQRKKIGLSRRTKRSIRRVNQTESKRQHVVSFLKSFKRKECMRFVENPDSRGRPLAACKNDQALYEKACFCGAPKDEHKTRIQVKLEDNKQSMDVIVEEDELSQAGSSTTLIDNDPPNKESMKKLKPAIYVVSPRSAVEDEEAKKEVDANEPTEKVVEEPWNIDADIHEFPNNAFGQIDFEGEDAGKPAKYVRLSDNTAMSKVLTLLVDYWGILKPQRPHLALSLIGGAKNFKMEGRKKEIFKSGLVSAAKSTNALILTGGCNAGTMKLVGDAVRQGQFYVSDGNNRMSRGLKLMGLTNWGYVKNNGLLINDDINSTHSCSYFASNEVRRGDNVYLNPDHTHFILIDDGSRYKHFGKYTEFITRLENMIRDQPPTGLGIPIVTLLLEGGIDAIRIIKDRLKEGIAAVVIEGSGRAADIIAYAYRNASKSLEGGSYTLKEGHIKHLNKMIDNAYGDSYMFRTEKAKKDNLKHLMNMTLECVRHSDIITTFDIRRETQLDKKILSALLKGQKMTLQHQLYLAMVWNRIDIAEEKIFVHGSLDSITKEDSLDDVMLQSLLMGRKAFIELLVMNGFVIKSFLTVEKLAILYNESAKTFKELHIQLESFCGIRVREIHLRHIHKLLQFMIKDHSHSNYKMHTQKSSSSKDVLQKSFDEPYMELFLWSILTGRLDLVEFFWRKIQSPFLGATLAASIYSKLAFFYKHQRNSNNAILYKLKQRFQEKVNKLCDISVTTDVNKATSILETRHARWGGRGLMELSYIGHLRTVIANPTCQMVVQQAWRRGFAKLSPLMCLLGIFLPFLLWTPLVKFQPGLGDDGGNLNPFQKMFVFYKCPVVKYTGICISYLIFILLYSYVILFGFRWEYQVPELCLYGWIAIIIFGEIREFVKEPSKRIKGKFKDYFSSIWNKFDAMFCVLTILALILRQFRSTFWYARIVLAITCAIYYLRFFRIYHASRNLGPKLVIFQRMVPEILTFLMLLLVFILAYGVASQAVIDPYRELSWQKVGELVQDIIFLPYWQMYGELSLENIQVVDSTGCSINSNLSYCDAPDLPNIRNSKTIAPIFLAIYLLVGNVMLLNLLIAIFTSVFEDVHENSNEVWKWEMFRLVAEYDSRPGLAPPLVFFEDIWRLSKFTWKHTCRRKRENLDAYMIETKNMLRLFEKECMDEYLEHEDKKEKSSLDSRLEALEKKTDTLLEMFEDAPDDSANWGELINADEKLYKTSSSSDSESSENESKKAERIQIAPVSRAQSARALRSYHEVHKEVNQLKDQIEVLESRRKADIDRLEQKVLESNDRIEKLLEKVLRNVDKQKK